MTARRFSGVLLHPTSLPGPNGIGEIGEQAHAFIEFLASAKQTLWQILPLGPTGYGDSPYASFSAFAGNPLLIDLSDLVANGDLADSDLSDRPAFPDRRVDFGMIYAWKLPLLERAAQRFIATAAPERRSAFAQFCSENAAWLDDYALFMTAKEQFGAKGAVGGLWNNSWDEDIALRRPKALERWKAAHSARIEIRKVQQYFFASQWARVLTHAHERGIRIIGDIPIFPAMDSVDVWSRRSFFQLDARGTPRAVAGVPPDYFSPTGQRWGNPLYDWRALEEDGFRWWIERISTTLKQVDIVRIDHFRGFAAFWEIPVSAPTAEKGRWVKAPGMKLFQAVHAALGAVPVIAEDLGTITPEVVKLRERFGFPGMRVLQFAFALGNDGLDGANPYLPHNHSEDCAVYTGTHDNDTTHGWYAALSPKLQDAVRRYAARDGHDIAWDLIRMALSSVARYAIIPMQDLLSLPSEARMNIPATVGGNWGWRLQHREIEDQGVVGRLREMTELYGRA